MKTNFFEYLDFALQFAPAGPEEKEIRAKLARIGIGPGKTFDFKDLSPEHKAEVAAGHERRRGKSGEPQSPTRARTSTAGGWADWPSATARLQRRLADARRRGARPASTATTPVEAMYPMTRTDSTGADARRQQAQLHAHLPRRTVSAGERLLVGDDV